MKKKYDFTFKTQFCLNAVEHIQRETVSLVDLVLLETDSPPTLNEKGAKQFGTWMEQKPLGQKKQKQNKTKPFHWLTRSAPQRAAERHVSTSYPRFNDGGSRVQNALHLPQGRDDKKITSDDGGHGVSWDKAVGAAGELGRGRKKEGDNHE